MGVLLFLLFVVVPVAEIALLIELGSLLGAAPTIAIVLATGALGAFLARREGLRIMTGWQQAVAGGKPPTDGLVDAILVAIGAALLLTPGILTDVVGFSLLIPWSRKRLSAPLRRMVLKKMQASVTTHSHWPPAQPEVIDVQATVQDAHVVDV